MLTSLNYTVTNSEHKPVIPFDNLNLFIDHWGMLRTKDRINKNILYEDEIINPVLLAKNLNLTKLMITENHKRFKHLGIQTTLNKIKLSGFWIPKTRQAVKSVISQCTISQKFNNLAFKYSKIITKSRVDRIKPYLHTGIDHPEHVWVKGEHGVCVIFWPFDPAKNAISRWCTGRRWHILMPVMRGNRVGGNWLMKWDEQKNSHGTLIDWRTGREWPLNCMTVISAWLRLNIRFQRSSGRSSGRWTIT